MKRTSAFAGLLFLAIPTAGCAQQQPQQPAKNDRCTQFDAQAAGIEQAFQDKLSSFYGLPITKKTELTGKTSLSFSSVAPAQITEELVARLNEAMTEYVSVMDAKAKSITYANCATPRMDALHDQTFNTLKQFQRYVARAIFQYPDHFDPQTVEDYKNNFGDDSEIMTPEPATS